MFRGLFSAIATVAMVAAFAAHQAAAQTPAEFFAGKTVQFMVGYPPSGGFDAYTRVAARFIGKHIPGNPTVIVVNKPGASSLTFVQYLATIAPKDGTQFGMFNRGLIPNSILEPKQTNVDFSQFTWIGSMSGEMAVCYMWVGKGLNTFENLKKAAKESVTLGDTSKNSGGYIYTSILRSLAPDSTKLVLGYPTTGDIWLAIERGELSGNCTLLSSIQSQRPEWISQKKIDVLIQFDEKRHTDLPNVPTIYELLPNENVKKAINFLTAAEAIGRPVIAPPGLAADRTAALRKAFMESMKDPELLAFAENAKMGIDAIPGDKAVEIVASIRNTSPEALELARQLME